MLRTRLTELLRIEHPILLAPMGSISGGALAAAVSAAGGLGLIGGGYGDRAWLETEFAAAGNQRVGCGFITWSLARWPELLDVALDQRMAAVMLSFGDPAPFIPKIKDAGALAICQVQSITEAEAAVSAGADIIVAQGTEAGGHGASRATLPFVPAVVDAVAAVAPKVPVLAAGGIADGRGLAAALALGADGVLVGTRFYAAAESLAHERAKRRVVEAKGDETLRTRVFDIVRAIDWPRPFTGRALRNDLSNRWHGREQLLVETGPDERERYFQAVAEGDFETAVIFAGEGVDMIRSVVPAAEIVRDFVTQAEASLDRAQHARVRQT